MSQRNMRAMSPHWLVFVLVGLGAMTTNALAELELRDKNWADEAELSFVDTSGNSKVRTLSAKNAMKYRVTESVTLTWKLDALHGEDGGTTTAERYSSDIRGGYAVTSEAFVFGNAGWRQDKFAGLDRETLLGLGYGYKLWTGPLHFLTLEGGAQQVQDNYTDDSSTDHTDARLFGEYGLAFAKQNRFKQTVELLYDFGNSEQYRANLETSLTSTLNERFSTKISYLVRYNHVPVPAALDTTDATFSVALVANF